MKHIMSLITAFQQHLNLFCKLSAELGEAPLMSLANNDAKCLTPHEGEIVKLSTRVISDMGSFFLK